MWGRAERGAHVGNAGQRKFHGNDAAGGFVNDAGASIPAKLPVPPTPASRDQGAGRPLARREVLYPASGAL